MIKQIDPNSAPEKAKASAKEKTGPRLVGRMPADFRPSVRNGQEIVRSDSKVHRSDWMRR